MYKMYYSAITMSRNEYFLSTCTYLMMKFLLDMIYLFPHHSLISCEDGEKSNFISRMFIKKYRTGRTQRPAEISVFFDKVYPLICESFKISRKQVKYHEADNMIAYQVAYNKLNNIQSVIASEDKDLLQLLDPENKVLVYRNKKLCSYNDLSDLYNIKPHQFICYMSLIGDSADVLPGIPGIGPVMAVKLLNKYDNLNEIYANIDEIKKSYSKYAALLEEHKRSLVITRMLFKLKTHRTKINVKNAKVISLIDLVPIMFLSKRMSLSPKKYKSILTYLVKIIRLLKKNKNEINYKEQTKK